MRKIFGVIAMVLLMYANSWAQSCLDMFIIPVSGELTKNAFKLLDEATAQMIKQVKEKIKKSHDEFEKDSKTTLENTRRLNKEYYVLQQDILHNQILINELQSLLTDTIASSAEAQKSKNSLDILKQVGKK
jgi:hypothetical protein